MNTPDYYQILGISPDAEDVVIKAAYRALVQRYHPDLYAGDAQFAHTRTQEIVEAYGVLSDPTRRAAYDEQRRAEGVDQNFQSQEEEKEEEEKSDAFDQALVDLESKWMVAVDVYPDLMHLRQDLAKVSRQLAFQFVVLMLEKQNFTERVGVANQLEHDFLERFFGSDPKLINFGRLLIFSGRRDAALGLNKMLGVVGSTTPADVLISKVRRDFKIKRFGMWLSRGRDRKNIKRPIESVLPKRRFSFIAAILAMLPLIFLVKAIIEQEKTAPVPLSSSKASTLPQLHRCVGNSRPLECEELERKLAAESQSERLARQRELDKAREDAMRNLPKVSPRDAKVAQMEITDSRPRTGYIRGETKAMDGGFSIFTIDNSTGSSDIVGRLYYNAAQPAVRSFTVRNGERFTVRSLTPGFYVFRYRGVEEETVYEYENEIRLKEEEGADGKTQGSRVKLQLYASPDSDTRFRSVSADLF